MWADQIDKYWFQVLRLPKPPKKLRLIFSFHKTQMNHNESLWNPIMRYEDWKDTCLCHVLTSLFPQQSSFANSPMANNEKSQLCVKFKRHNTILINQHSVATVVNHNYALHEYHANSSCATKGKIIPTSMVASSMDITIIMNPKIIACPTRKARSMLALARPVPATMVQWLRGVNPRLGLKKSP